MSMDHPNEYEKAIEAYAEAVRLEYETALKAKRAADAAVSARDDRQDRWRTIKHYLAEGKIKPGMYRVKSGSGADGVLIQPGHDYPELFQMFR